MGDGEDDGETSDGWDGEGADGALELLLHFARGGGTGVLAKLAAAADSAYVARDMEGRAAPLRGVLRRAYEARSSAPDAAAAAAALGGSADERAAAAVRLMAARAARGCSRIHDAAVRTCVGRSEAKRAVRRAERAGCEAVSQIRAIAHVVAARGRRYGDARRRIRRADRAAVHRVLEALALALGLLHLAIADASGDTKTRGSVVGRPRFKPPWPLLW